MKRLALLFVFALAASALGAGQERVRAPEFRKEEWLRIIDDIRGSDPKLRLDAAKELDRKTHDAFDQISKALGNGVDVESVRASFDRLKNIFDIPEVHLLTCCQTPERLVIGINGLRDPKFARLALLQFLPTAWQSEPFYVGEESEEEDLDEIRLSCGMVEADPPNRLFAAISRKFPALYHQFIREAGPSARAMLLEYYDGPWEAVESYVYDLVERQETFTEGLDLLGSHPTETGERLLLWRLQNRRAEVRLASLNALVKGFPRVAWNFVPQAFLTDRSKDLRAYVEINGLDYTDRRAVPFVRFALTASAEEAVRKTIGAAVGSKVSAVITEVAGYARNPRASERLYALQALRLVQTPDVRALFESVAEDADTDELQTWCVWAAAQGDQSLFPRLQRLARNENQSLARSARIAMASLLLGLRPTERDLDE